MNDEKKNHIERTIRRCALELHPSGELRHLAAELGVTAKVFRYWITRGRVPKVKATWLETRFGKEIADAATLIA